MTLLQGGLVSKSKILESLPPFNQAGAYLMWLRKPLPVGSSPVSQEASEIQINNYVHEKTPGPLWAVLGLGFGVKAEAWK